MELNLGGMNLTMALTAVVMKDVLDGDDLAATILSEARSALQPFEVSALVLKKMMTIFNREVPYGSNICTD